MFFTFIVTVENSSPLSICPSFSTSVSEHLEKIFQFVLKFFFHFILIYFCLQYFKSNLFYYCFSFISMLLPPVWLSLGTSMGSSALSSCKWDTIFKRNSVRTFAAHSIGWYRWRIWKVKILKEGEIWKLEQSKKFRSWMEKTWLPEHKAKIFFLIRSSWREIL